MGRTHFYRAIFGFWVLALCISSSYAQITPEDIQKSLRQENVILQFQQRELDAPAEEKKQDLLKNPPPPSMQLSPEEISPIKGKLHCFPIKDIELSGVTKLSKRQQEKLIKPHLRKCLDINQINALLRDITNTYIKKGYITTRAYLPKQNIKQGRLKIRVIEGKIKNMRLNENSFWERLQLMTAFPNMKDDVLNIRDIEQGLDQINRLPSNTATIKLLPGQQPGTTDLRINNLVKGRTRLTISYDNAGSESTGDNQWHALWERDNLLRINDAWTLSYNEDDDPHSAGHFSRSYAGSFSVPYGYWMLSMNASYSEYLTTIKGVNQTFESSGDTNTLSGTLSRLVYRDQYCKVTAGLGLTSKDTENFIENTKLETGSRRLVPLRFNLDYFTRGWGGTWNTDLAYIRGLRSFGAIHDPHNLPADQPRAQFDKLTLNVNLYRPFQIKKSLFAYQGKLYFQYSPDVLFGSERLGIGDQYTVYGFKDDSLQADTGGYWRNKVIYHPIFLNKGMQKIFNGLEGFAALDIGAGRTNDGLESGMISGAAVGLQKNSQWLRFNLTYAVPIITPSRVDESTHEIYFSVGVFFS